jgi:hypothetical protein
MNKFFTTPLPTATIAAIGLTVAATVAVSNPAQAFTLGCANSIANKVTNATSCGVGAANQDSVSNNRPLTVNTEGFFGFTDWKFGGKIGENAGYTGTKSGKSGTWNLSSVFQSSWQDVMLVFKSGNNTKLTGYLLADNVSSGQWSSPFDKDVSHISVYFREGSAGGGNSAAVPEPTTMAGIALAGTGLAAYRRRRNQLKG